ncbi:MAG: protein-L-isoaspartate(D-aspartate) O-methyltransferase [Pseudomonadota bacterium]
MQTVLDQGDIDQSVLDAMDAIDRSLFVPSFMHEHVYEDSALPIGEGQTISQPSLVAQMITLLGLDKTAKVLEIGTGCGYQTAILSRLAGRVFSLEYNEKLAKSAYLRLETLRHKQIVRNNIVLRKGNGWLGWPQQIDFQAIIVSAAAAHLPQKLCEQLDLKQSVMVIPIGLQNDTQKLICLKVKDGKPEYHEITNVKFVPLIDHLV